MPDEKPIAVEKFKEDICETGRRVYAKNFAAANEGNISIRISDDRVLVTPTLTCKGFMTPGDICTVDMDGTQVAGTKKRTSEVKLHLEIYKRRTDVKSVVHCHPPHATAFGVAREPIPNCVLPEPDIFLGEVPIAPYETPGSKQFAETILPFVETTNTIILANHGTVSYESTVERAYWLTEILDAYCRILILAKQIGRVQYVPLDKGKELLDLRKEWGFEDPRYAMEKVECDVCNHMQFRDHWESAQLAQRGFAPFDPAKNSAPSSDALAQMADEIARRVIEKLKPEQ